MVAARGWRTPQTGRLVGAWAGLASIAVLAALSGLGGWGDLALLVVAGLTTASWVILTERAERTDRGQGLALSALAGGAGLVVLLSGWSTPVAGAVARWLDWTAIDRLDSLDPTRLLLLAGLFLTQLSTGNLVVRLVLAHTGALNPHGGPQASDRLRGGRLLGPMERVFILGLGLAGQVTAASIVIAAKGLIRWPELQKATRDSERLERDTERRERASERRERDTERRDGAGPTGDSIPRPVASIDQVTEYFLIGSFVSWLLALSALVVAHLS
nr:hypothetical protein [Ornithinimicrobium cryptoxanthini]